MHGLQEAFINLMIVLITGGVSYLSAKLTQYFKQKGVIAAFDKKKESVQIAVDAVEQIAKVEQLDSKYLEAKSRAVDLLNEQGITITNSELDSLIEAAVRGLKQGYTENK